MSTTEQFERMANALDMTLPEWCSYMVHRVKALEAELSKTNDTILEISEISTAKARDLKVIISDPNFDKPLKELYKNY